MWETSRQAAAVAATNSWRAKMPAWADVGHVGPSNEMAGYTTQASAPASTTAPRLYERTVSTMVTTNRGNGTSRP